MRLDLVEEALCSIDGNGESNPNRAKIMSTFAATGNDEAIDPDDLTQGIHQRTTTVAVIDRGIRLDHVAVVVVALRLLEVSV